jgi:hypothetical protein
MHGTLLYQKPLNAIWYCEDLHQICAKKLDFRRTRGNKFFQLISAHSVSARLAEVLHEEFENDPSRVG